MVLSKTYPNFLKGIAAVFGSIMISWSIMPGVYDAIQEGVQSKSLFISFTLSAYNFSGNSHAIYSGMILLLSILFCTYFNLVLSSKAHRLIQFIFGVIILFLYCALFFWENVILIFILISALFWGIAQCCTKRSNVLIAVILATVSYVPMGILGLCLISIVGFSKRGLKYSRSQEFLVSIDGIIASSVIALALYWVQ